MAVAATLVVAGSAAAQSYTARTLTTNVCCGPENFDPHLVSAWGVAMGRTGAVWVTVPKSGIATLYNGDGKPQALVVRMQPPPGAGASSPMGIVSNGGGDFVVSNGAGGRGPARFLFATVDGTIDGWAPTAAPLPQNTRAVVAVDRSAGSGGPMASYTGLGIASTSGGGRLYAADFLNRRIDTFDGSFAPVAAAFTDPNLPPGFVPYNVRVLGGRVYVAYALADADGGVVKGAGLGIVDLYKDNGEFVRRIATGHALNAPWGMAIAPANFGGLSNALLVANTGDGKINAWDPQTGTPVGAVGDAAGDLIVIDGLRGIEFGNGVLGQQANALFYTASPSFAVVGEFGRIDQSCPADFDGNGLIEPADISRFITTWFESLQQGTLAGDFDGDGAVAPADVSRFVSVWFAGLATGC